MAGMNWFVPMIQALAKGNASAFLTCNNPCDVRYIAWVLGTIDDAGLTRDSRKCWTTLDHPVLGTIQWKRGFTPFGGGSSEYFMLRINGVLVLKAWPTPDLRLTYCKWVTVGASTDDEIHLVERVLGTLQVGTSISTEERDQQSEIFSPPVRSRPRRSTGTRAD